MNFAGKKVFFNLEPRKEVTEESANLVLQDEMEGDFLSEVTASKAERASRRRKKFVAPRGSGRSARGRGGHRFAAAAAPVSHVQEADTNVVAIDFGSLAQKPEDMFAGDPIFCGGCQCVLSSTSRVQTREEAEKEQKAAAAPAVAKPAQLEEAEEVISWVCEFCGHWNEIDVEPEEVPKVAVRDYVLEPAPVKETKGQEAENMVVFVIDSSGSMGATQEVPGTIQLKGMKASDEPEFDLPPELQAEYRQLLAQQRRNVTHVSRMQCVQAAVEQQIEDWHKAKSRKRVAVVAFNREVTVIGDGTRQPEVIAGDKLNDQGKLEAIGQAWSERLENPITQTYPELSKRLFKLDADGATALGPALTVAAAMAGTARGSSVVLCTDGLANIGLGSLDHKEEEARERSEAWYEAMGQKAVQQGTTVSIISIKGDECSLEALGALAEVTGGTVKQVNPLELQSNFAAMLAVPVLATSVKITFILHRGLKFRNEDVETHRLVRDVGNVTADSELTFEFGVNPLKARELQHLKRAPFQVQIFYTRPDGMKLMRVLSEAQELTESLEDAQQDLRMEILAANCAQQSARMAEAGEYEGQMAYNVSWGRFMHKNAKTPQQRGVFQKFAGQMESFHRRVQNQHQSLASTGLQAGMLAPPRGPVSKQEKRKRAKHARKDEDYSEMQMNRCSRSRAFL